MSNGAEETAPVVMRDETEDAASDNASHHADATDDNASVVSGHDQSAASAPASDAPPAAAAADDKEATEAATTEQPAAASDPPDAATDPPRSKSVVFDESVTAADDLRTSQKGRSTTSSTTSPAAGSFCSEDSPAPSPAKAESRPPPGAATPTKAVIAPPPAEDEPAPLDGTAGPDQRPEGAPDVDQALAGAEIESDGQSDPPPTPPEPLTERQLLDMELNDLIRQLKAAEDAATPSPLKTKSRVRAVAETSLARASTRHQSGFFSFEADTTVSRSFGSPNRSVTVTPKTLFRTHSPGASPLSRSAGGTPSGSAGRLAPLEPSASKKRLEDARNALDTDTRLGRGPDNLQAIEVKLGEVMAENKALATRHAAVMDEYRDHMAAKERVEHEHAAHRKAVFDLKKEQRLLTTAHLALEREVLANHAAIRDFAVKLQRQRLKRTEEEIRLQERCDAVKAELATLTAAMEDEERDFQMTYEARRKRATMLEQQLACFSPTKYVEEYELQELRGAMELRTIAAVREAAPANGLSTTFTYSGAGWASNDATAAATQDKARDAKPETPPANPEAHAKPRTPQSRSPAPASPKAGKTPKASQSPPPTSSVELLKADNSATTPNISSIDVRDSDDDDDDDANHPDVSDPLPEQGPDHAKRLELALRDYKRAVAAPPEARLRLNNFLAGQFS